MSIIIIANFLTETLGFQAQHCFQTRQFQSCSDVATVAHQPIDRHPDMPNLSLRQDELITRLDIHCGNILDHGQRPAKHRLPSRNSFLDSTEAIDTSKQDVRTTLWVDGWNALGDRSTEWRDRGIIPNEHLASGTD